MKMDQNQKEKAAAWSFGTRIRKSGTIVWVGKPALRLIFLFDALASKKNDNAGQSQALDASTQRLKKTSVIDVFDLRFWDDLDIYVDGADEITSISTD